MRIPSPTPRMSIELIRECIGEREHPTCENVSVGITCANSSGEVNTTLKVTRS